VGRSLSVFRLASLDLHVFNFGPPTFTGSAGAASMIIDLVP
jgi:hypothetical protein